MPKQVDSEEMVSLIPIETRNELTQYLAYWDSVRSIEVSTGDQYDSAVEICKKIKGHIKELEARRVELKAPYKEKTDYIDKEFKLVRDTLEKGEAVLKRAMSGWYAAEQRRIAEANAKAEAEAEVARQKAAAAAQKEHEKALAYREQGREDMAQKAEARAETAIDKALSTVAEIATPETKGKGTSYTPVYRVAVVDKAEFVRAAIGNAMLMPFITIDEAGLSKMAKTLDGKLDVAGITVTKDFQVGVRR